jgi:molybdate transport system substrate-binding protein
LLLTAALWLSLADAATLPQAAEIRVLSGGAIAQPLATLATQFEHASGHRIVFQAGTTPELIRMMTGGARFDLFVGPTDVLDDPTARSRVLADHLTNVVRVGLGVAVRTGAPRPDISTPDALRRTLLAAHSIATIPASATGARLLRIFDDLGIGEAMKSRLRVQTTPADITRAVVSGQAELAVFLTNVLVAPGVDLVGPFPPQLQQEVVFTGAVARDAAEAKAARDFLVYLVSPDAVAVFRSRGLNAE